MRIVIDMQGAQSTGSRSRGIGRYTMWLTQAMARNKGAHEIIVALNGAFPDTIAPIRQAFDNLLPKENIRVWQPVPPLAHIDSTNTWRRKTAELLRESFLASLKPDIVLISSLFEGLVDDAVSSVATLSNMVPTACILYDLIPLIHRHPYLENPAVEAWYENKLDHMRRIDLALAISDSSRSEGIRYLGFSENNCISISTATDPQFRPIPIDAEREASTRKRYGLDKAFVMYTGGIDHRKNIEGLIRAYASLPCDLRAQHQLAVVCSIHPQDRDHLKALAKECELKESELVLTGFVPEEDLIAIYNLCKLFVFPSWHEGFGLPALEAMACGRAVIGACTSSVPEVIGRKDALFDPHSDSDIATKMAQVLTEGSFREELERHGLEQAKKFSWDICAQRAIAAMGKWHEDQAKAGVSPYQPVRRPRLAYISPLPPERSGISDYSAELLPELARHYDIEVVVTQGTISDPWIKENCPARSVEWLRQHAHHFDRVLYHFGNSAFHQHMFSLLEEIPGVVVLHDFFLSGIMAHMEASGFLPGNWIRELYRAHGYAALLHRFHAEDTAETIWAYPCNLSSLENAQGIIVHAEASRRLARAWYGEQAGETWAVIPLLRVATYESEREAARESLQLSVDDFVVCSFGLLGPTKLNHRLLEAWFSSSLAKDPHCVLVLVGENHPGDYGQQLLKTIRGSGLSEQIRITGWADTDTFRRYLAAANVGVQLRTLSRGETSAAVLDCMNYGLPTIVNANGSMADLPDDGVWKLPDTFENSELITALETLWQHPERRRQLGSRAQEIIRTQHAPRACAEQYAAAIERFHRESSTGLAALIQRVAELEYPHVEDSAWQALAQSISQSIPAKHARRQLLVDISGLEQKNERPEEAGHLLETLRSWIQHPPGGCKVEPVYFSVRRGGFCYARHFTLQLLDCPDDALPDEPVDLQYNDLFFGIAPQPRAALEREDHHAALCRLGIRTAFLVNALPDFSRPGKELEQWLKIILQSKGAICQSRQQASQLKKLLDATEQKILSTPKIDWLEDESDAKVSDRSEKEAQYADILLRSLGL